MKSQPQINLAQSAMLAGSCSMVEIVVEVEGGF